MICPFSLYYCVLEMIYISMVFLFHRYYVLELSRVYLSRHNVILEANSQLLLGFF